MTERSGDRRGCRHPRDWCHLDLAGLRVSLRTEIRRVECRDCVIVVVDEVPWALSGVPCTLAFEERAGYRTQRCDRTTVADIVRATRRTVDSIIEIREVGMHAELLARDAIYARLYRPPFA
jgi:transposase